MKHLKLFEAFLEKSGSMGFSKFKNLIDGLDTLEGFIEVDDQMFRDFIGSIRKDADANPPHPHYNAEDEYYRIEREHDEKDSAYKAICDFLGESSSNILYIWNSNNIGGSSEPNVEEYCELIDKLFGKYLDMNASETPTHEYFGRYSEAIDAGPKPKDYLGAPKKTIVIEEEDVNYHKISMYQSRDGLKFVSWGWGVDRDQTTDWMCTRSLVESSLSHLDKNP